jgi:FAD:protein FMN transferase
MTALRHIEHCMGTVFSFDIRDPGVDRAAVTGAVALLHEIDARYSTYQQASVISRLGRGEITLTDCDAEVTQVLDECDRWRQRTDGWFSAYAGDALDPSGYVKGWAIQRASDLLVAAGSENHCINGGGDVQCVGRPAPTELWRVGITDPLDHCRLATVVAGSGIAVATSGSAERGAHILDPATGQSAHGDLLSLTVTGHSIVECDVYATAGFAMGAASREWFKARRISAFAVRADGSTWSTF